MLGHYDAVIWYWGNDFLVREPGWGPGNVSRLAVDETLEIRQYLNEGGKLLYTGQWAGGHRERRRRQPVLRPGRQPAVRGHAAAAERGARRGA